MKPCEIFYLMSSLQAEQQAESAQAAAVAAAAQSIERKRRKLQAPKGLGTCPGVIMEI